jgi:hypothetical protein
MLRTGLGWQLLGASVAGSKHLDAGGECQDRHGYLELPNGTLLIAVADGAGSATYAATGADCAVKATLASLEKQLTAQEFQGGAAACEALLRSALIEARASLEALPNEAHPQAPVQGTAPSRLRDFATTLLAAVIAPDWAGALQVGDGAIVARRADAAIQALTWPVHGEYINETAFVTAANYLSDAQFVTLAPHDISGIALFTDGIEFLALDMAGRRAYPPYFAGLFAFATERDANEEELVTYLESERVCARTDDDKTLVLAVRT